VPDRTSPGSNKKYMPWVVQTIRSPIAGRLTMPDAPPYSGHDWLLALDFRHLAHFAETVV